ncbi:hypothetical protein Moror_721 [Moniliophthora roreri MCA 2997]|uniref:Uncharacterized protein n=1 Tax=Moniliophthora roreri (strain MCA 2997) TaxID=1381753 RepID=V2X896_MONRO|nr:hypothetical protein Moror_721 [Moniliophthora roreri MCA 2997]
MLRDLTIQGSCTGILDIPHVLDKLTRLSLESMPPMDFTVASILARTPHLKELYIDGFVGNHLISALSEMNPSELDGHPQLVPELSVLRLFATPLFSVVTFKNMVHKRNLLGRPLYVSCALHLASNVRYTFSGYKRTTCIQSGEYFSIDRVKELDEETKFSEKVQALVEAFVEPAQFMQNATQYDILLSGIECMYRQELEPSEDLQTALDIACQRASDLITYGEIAVKDEFDIKRRSLALLFQNKRLFFWSKKELELHADLFKSWPLIEDCELN